MSKYKQSDAHRATGTRGKQGNMEGMECQVQCRNTVGQRLTHRAPGKGHQNQ